MNHLYILLAISCLYCLLSASASTADEMFLERKVKYTHVIREEGSEGIDTAMPTRGMQPTTPVKNSTPLTSQSTHLIIIVALQIFTLVSFRFSEMPRDCIMIEDTFSFLITTDNHLGYKKDDHLRRKDPFMAFEEALDIARERDVDFILLGGDLFHENRPSAGIEHKCIKIIRQHMSKVTRSTSFKRVSGNFSHFHKISHANFEDPNFTVPYPIMTIHGNHDDPTGPSAQSVCEKLATCGLLNYFGAVTSKDCYVIEPIILQKDSIKIALYGLGFIPDYKLKLAFDKGEVEFSDPPKDTYNVLVVHQNRVPFQKNKVIPDDLFPTFFHLIIRGHEHNTQSPEPIPGSKVNGLVYQPGSTVATSISMMEAKSKRVGLIKVGLNNPNGDSASLFKMDYELIDLKYCRCMIMKDISQKDIFKHIKLKTGTKKVAAADFKKISQDYVDECIVDLLREYRLSRSKTEDPKMQRFDLPLLRIRLEYTSKHERFDELDLSLKFYPSKVANKDIILFKKQKLGQSDGGDVENVTFVDEDEEDDQEEIDYINLGEEKRDTIDVMIEGYFKDKPPNQRLQALSLTEYTNAVKGSHEDGNVISKVLNKKKKELLEAFKHAISSEEVAETKFHNSEVVENWFLHTMNIPDVTGDNKMEVIFCD